MLLPDVCDTLDYKISNSASYNEFGKKTTVVYDLPVTICPNFDVTFSVSYMQHFSIVITKPNIMSILNRNINSTSHFEQIHLDYDNLYEDI